MNDLLSHHPKCLCLLFAIREDFCTKEKKDPPKRVPGRFSYGWFLENRRRPVFQDRFHFLAELVCQCTIDQAVIESKRQVGL
jgi:hypothetical protein